MEDKGEATETQQQQQQQQMVVEELPPIDESVVFRKEDFDREAHVLGVVVRASAANAARVALEPVMLHLRKVRNIRDVPTTAPGAEPEKMLLLAEEYATVAAVVAHCPGTPAAAALAPFVETAEEQEGKQEQEANKQEQETTETGWRVERVEHGVAVAVYWQSVGLGAMLQALLPAAAVRAAGGEVPTAFETVGHIAHVNLRAPLLPYRHAIGAAVLAKNPRLRTVVTKTASIENAYRTFPLAVIAGAPALETDVRESGCVFRLNLADVYWNSRLQTEHARLVATLGRAAAVWDLMAGVGPFALPAARNGCTVAANDLNPRSYAYLVENRARNAVDPARCVCSNLDARAFVRQHVHAYLQRHGGSSSSSNGGTSTSTATPASAATATTEGGVPALPSHVIMNLPATALEFLDVFGDAVRGGWPGRPVIHCYCFSRSLDAPAADIAARARAAIGPEGVVVRVRDVHDVRDVAPGKHMYLITLRVFAATDAAVPSEEEERAAHVRELRDALTAVTAGSTTSSKKSAKTQGIKRARE